MTNTTPEQNKALALQAFDTLFNKRDDEAAARFWSDAYPAQRSHRSRPRWAVQFDQPHARHTTIRDQLIVAEGDYVIVHGRFSGTGRSVAWIAADIVRIGNGRLAEHWDVLQDEATKAESKSGLPMFGDRFTA
jgi:predicted SnoaL-like aldol condensation-catalyzing enzyme